MSKVLLEMRPIEEAPMMEWVLVYRPTAPISRRWGMDHRDPEEFSGAWGQSRRDEQPSFWCHPGIYSGPVSPTPVKVKKVGLSDDK